jgi:two-component system NtrC family response regulator
MEKQHICKVLKKTKGNRTQAAKILGIGLRTLQRKLKTLSDSHTTPK